MNTVTYKFTDDMFPSRELIEPALNKLGFELASNYSGNSQDPALAYIFNYLIENENLDVVEMMSVEVPKLRPNILENALGQRYKLNPYQYRILQRIMIGDYKDSQNGIEELNIRSIKDFHYVIAFIYALNISNQESGHNAKVIYNEIQSYWKEKYNSVTRAPFSFIENFGKINYELVKRKQDIQYNLGSLYEGRNIMRAGIDQIRNRVQVAFMFNSDTVVKLVSLGLNAESIIQYVNSGISSSKDILEWAENMPSEWADALLSGAK